MNKVEEENIKLLLVGIVDDIFSCFESNQYTAGVKQSIRTKIAGVDLLTPPKVPGRVLSVQESQDLLKGDRQ